MSCCDEVEDRWVLMDGYEIRRSPGDPHTISAIGARATCWPRGFPGSAVRLGLSIFPSGGAPPASHGPLYQADRGVRPKAGGARRPTRQARTADRAVESDIVGTGRLCPSPRSRRPAGDRPPIRRPRAAARLVPATRRALVGRQRLVGVCRSSRPRSARSRRTSTSTRPHVEGQSPCQLFENGAVCAEDRVRQGQDFVVPLYGCFSLQEKSMPFSAHQPARSGS